MISTDTRHRRAYRIFFDAELAGRVHAGSAVEAGLRLGRLLSDETSSDRISLARVESVAASADTASRELRGHRRSPPAPRRTGGAAASTR